MKIKKELIKMFKLFEGIKKWKAEQKARKIAWNDWRVEHSDDDVDGSEPI
jgi:hypothetical protein